MCRQPPAGEASWRSTPRTSRRFDLHNVKIEGYEGERLHFVNVGHFEED